MKLKQRQVNTSMKIYSNKILMCLFAFFILVGCKTQYELERAPKMTHFESSEDSVIARISGKYIRIGSTKYIELKSTGEFVLYKPSQHYSHSPIDQCDEASRGQWYMLSEDVIALNSDNNYIQQAWEHEIHKGKIASDDSLYIDIQFPNDFNSPMTYSIYMNYKHFVTHNHQIVLPRHNNLNPTISITIAPDISGALATRYYSRSYFGTVETTLETDENHLIIIFPNFNICAYEFEVMDKDLIHVMRNGQLFFRGKIWDKKIHTDIPISEHEALFD